MPLLLETKDSFLGKLGCVLMARSKFQKVDGGGVGWGAGWRKGASVNTGSQGSSHCSRCVPMGSEPQI